MNKVLNFFLLCVMLASFAGCVKFDVDEPPYDKEFPTLNTNFSIKDLSAMHTPGGLEKITDDLVIKVVVVADDKTGNYYKTLVVQDSTGGMEVKINAVNLFNIYPEGRQLYLKLKGLTLGDYNGNFQVGGGVFINDNGENQLGGIEEPYLDEYIVKGAYNVSVTPAVRTISQLGAADINTLVEIQDVQFADAELGNTFADAVGKITVNRTLKDCANGSIVLRTSGYSTFAGDPIPEGKGNIVAIYTVFGTTKQLFLRRPSDAPLTGDRCGTGGTTGEPIDISSVRALYQGSTTSVPSEKKIKGIVISDRANNNITSKNVVVFQPGNAGITVRFTENNPFNLGDEIEINVGGQELSEFNGLIQINNVPLINTSRLATGKTVTPTVLTVSSLEANFELYESQLVTIKDAELSKSSGNTFSGDVTLSDATGSVSLFTQSYANFSGDAFPTGKVNVTGIVNQGGNQSAKQINIRSKTDIEGGSVDPPGGDLDEQFNNITNDVDISLAGWLNIAEKGTRVWRGKTFNSEKYAQATSYNATDEENVTWLISPGITLDKPKQLTFQSALQVYKHDGLEVLASTDFDGTNVASATWTKLNPVLAGSGTADHVWVDSGPVDLSGFSGKIYVAFKYTGTASANTTSYRVDNVKIADK